MNNNSRTTPVRDTPSLRELAERAFARDLPELVRVHLGCWVVYHGDRQVAIARHTGELYETCRQQGLSLMEVILFEIAAPDEEVTLSPMAFD